MKRYMGRMGLGGARAVLLVCVGLALSARVGATPVSEYLNLRRQLGYNARLSYSAVAADWSSYMGAVLEIRGRLNGYIQGEKALTFMLTLDDGTAVTLTATSSDASFLMRPTTGALRVLVRVRDGILGNVVPLETLAVTDDAEVTYRERVALEAEQRRQAAKRRSASRHIPATSGLRLRPLAGATAGLSEMALRYLTPEAQSIYPAYYAFIANHNKRLSPQEADAIAVSILYFAHRHRVDPRLIVAMIIAESDFDPRSTSHKGAMGLGQVMPDEARAFGLRNPYDPIENVRASVNMLRMKLDMFRERGVPEGQMTMRQIALAMAAYNAGAGAVKRYGGVPPYRETQRYVQRVITLYNRLCGR